METKGEAQKGGREGGGPTFSGMKQESGSLPCRGRSRARAWVPASGCSKVKFYPSLVFRFSTLECLVECSYQLPYSIGIVVQQSFKMNREKLMKMASAVRTGGKGSVRRKKKAVHKTTSTDDKRLQSTLKRLGVNTIPGIEEVNIFLDENVIHFVNPKVQASIAANTWVVSGPSQTKKLEDILPSIFNQLGPDNLANLKKLQQLFQRKDNLGGIAEEEDDDVPELVGETFEDAAKEEPAK